MPEIARFRGARSEEWGTPGDIYDPLNAEFRFTLDAAASRENHKVPKYFTREDDGLSQSWSGERVWVNPPYGRSIPEWVRKADMERHAEVIVMLLPVRTDTRWFHEWVLPRAELRFIRGRIKFDGAPWNAPFPSMLAIYWGESSKCGIYIP